MEVEGLQCTEIHSNSGRTTYRAFSATSASVVGPRKTTESFDRVGRSEGLPNVNSITTDPYSALCVLNTQLVCVFC
jgi:hypothetical protein